MKHVLQIFSVLVIFAVMSLFIGCSSSTSSDPKTVGDFNDPSYLDVVDITDGTDEFNGMMFDFLGEMIGMVMSDPAHPSPQDGMRTRSSNLAAADSLLMTYHENTSFWYFYIHSEDTLYLDGGNFELLTMTVEDSIRFFHGQSAVQWPDSALLTRVENGTMFEIGLGGSAYINTFWNVNVAGVDIFAVGDVVINGSNGAELSIVDEGETCSAVAGLEGVISNVATNILYEDNCPSSGYIQQNGNFNITCEGDTTYNHNDNWMIQQTFLGDSIAVVVENSTDRWEYTTSCGPTQTVSPLETMTGLLR